MERGNSNSERNFTTSRSPENNASFISKVTFSWFTRTLFTGFKRPLTQSDIWDLQGQNKAERIYHSLLLNLKLQATTKKYARNRKNISVEEISLNHMKEAELLVNDSLEESTLKRVHLLGGLLKTFGPFFLFTVFLKFILLALRLANPEILRRLLVFTSSSSPQWQGYLLAMGFLLVALARTLVSAQYFRICAIISMRLRSSITSIIYRKSLVLSNSASKEMPSGKVINLISVDASRLAAAVPVLNVVWAGPLLVIATSYFLWTILGVSVFAGLAVMFILIPINTVFSGRLKKFKAKELKIKDQRIKLMNEVLSGIKAIKMYAWELSFKDKILRVRNVELTHLKHAAYLSCVFFFIYLCTPFFVSLAMFALYVLMDEHNVLDAQKIFVSIALVNILKYPLIEMSMAVSTITQIVNILLKRIGFEVEGKIDQKAYVSYKRILAFLNCSEFKSNDIGRSTQSGDAIVISNASFKWKDTETETLSNITASVPYGSLVAVVGQVGCGKSSLLSALLGDIEKTNGQVAVKGSVAYVPQQPWIQNLTVRENILFGTSYDAHKYNQAIELCELKQDLETLSAGDGTEIGERGLNLSGGQKQRVSLARAVYQDRQIYLFDDPLSAVDSNVGKNIFEHVIGPDGCLKNKTRVLVTHGLSFLSQVDLILVLAEGKIIQVGSYSDLLAEDGHFAEVLKSYTHNCELETKDTTCVDSSKNFSSNVSSVSKIHSTHLEQDQSNNHKLIDREREATGNVGCSVLRHYFKSAGYVISLIAFLAVVLQNATLVGYGIWLAEWSNDSLNTDGTQNGTLNRLFTYTVLGITQGALVMVQTFLMYAFGVKASKGLHEVLLSKVLRYPMKFFDKTPTGRIINRFSKDMDTIDHALINTLSTSLNTFLYMIGSFFVISFATPYFALAVIPLFLLYFFIQRFYIRSSRQLRRIQSTTSSPIYSHFTETLSGVSVIRAYGLQGRFMEENLRRNDAHHKISYASIIATRWLALRLNLVGAVLVTLAAVLAVSGKGSIDAGYVGLSITHAIQVTLILNRLVLRLSELESSFVAVERLREYSSLETEAPLVENNQPALNWPAEGCVTFDRYSTKYREELDLVVEDICFDIASGEKIGIVGRTGAGKSSLTLALFRLIEASSGTITIDGVNIATIGLQDLRSRLSILPQDPVLFSGSLRMNLDPFEKYSDEKLWDALEHSHLKDFVVSLPAKLNHEVMEGGDNLSVGQRQLVCLARALLRKSKILILDEATAAVDLETDNLIQAAIRTNFEDCTVFAIVHRLNAVMESSRILVLCSGRVIEFDTPENLVKRKGVFYTMALDAGLI